MAPPPSDGPQAEARHEDPFPCSLNVLVLGAGNILLSDEGIGVRVVEALQQRHQLPEGVEVLDGGTCGMDLLDVIAGRDHLILVDAVDTGSPPGRIVRLQDDEIPAVFRTKSSPHQLGLQDVLAMLRLLDQAPAHVTVIGVQPASLELGLELTPLIAGRLEVMLDMIKDELAVLSAASNKRAATEGEATTTVLR
ncbi:MAG: HyaD/HybD family hydrogenase maturation endopeptidase [Rhodoplanes sp.]